MERALISKIVTSRTYPLAVELGIGLDHFLDDDHRDAWSLLSKHFGKYGRSMGRDAFKANQPSYKILDTPETTEWYVEQVKEVKRQALAEEMTADLLDAVEDRKVDEVIRVASLGLQAITAETGKLSDHDVTSNWEKRYQTYQEWHESGNAMRGIPTGYNSVDTTSRGLQPGNMVVIAGAPGVGKTTLALSIARHVHEEQYKVVVVSFEMSYEEIASRYDAQRAGISHHRMIGGRLGEPDMVKLKRAMKSDQDNETFIISEDISQMTTVSGLHAKVQQHKPDLLVVDGAYMMQDENGETYGSPQALTNVSRGLSMMCKTEKIPLLVTTQALLSKMRGGRVTMGSLGYTSAWAQDASVLLGLSADPQDPEQALLDTLKSRNGPRAEATLEWNHKDAIFYEMTSTLEDLDRDQDRKDKEKYEDDESGRRGRRRREA